MNLSTSSKGNCLIIEINEEKIDIGNSIEFRNALSKHTDAGQSVIIIDMKKVDFIDSSGIGVLITFFHFTVDSNKQLKLANCQPKVVDTMKTTKLDNKIPLFPSVEAAIG